MGENNMAVNMIVCNKCLASHTELILDPQPEVEPICLKCGQGYLVLEHEFFEVPLK